MLYLENRPYWDNEGIYPYVCEGGLGNPSGHALMSTAVYLSAWT